MFKPRPGQADVLAYNGGKMGVSAVPGSGKTATLSYLGAKLVAQGDLADDQEVLIVTLVKSAVGNFASSMANFLRDEFNLLPGLGYRVRTLHGLANDIVRERPALAGLSDSFSVIDERVSQDILQEAVDSWVRTHPNAPDAYLNANNIDDTYTRTTRWSQQVVNIAGNFIKQAKDMQLSADDIADALAQHSGSLPLARMCVEIYTQYEKGLRYRGAVDFQDLIRLALRVLKQDADYLERLRHRWPYILEDEAQDSSKLQEDILRLLAGENGNWVRVGDPNQAIYETFTTADPKYLRAFLREADVQAKKLPSSGRSTGSIINVANSLIEWSLEHPIPALREKEPLTPPYIKPTPPGDPQGNPPDSIGSVHLWGEKMTSEQERNLIMRSLQQWLPEHPDKTCAVLLPINSSGAKMVQALRTANLPYVENLRSTSGTRAVVGTLWRVVDYLSDPKDSSLLARTYRAWRRDERGDEDAERSIENIARELHRISRVEDFIWPRPEESGWLYQNAAPEDNADLHTHLSKFRTVVRRWQQAADLPVDQLILTLSADLFTLEPEIATAYSVALYLRSFADDEPGSTLADFSRELNAIARGQRKFSGLSDEDESFDPDKHRGKVTVTTMHKAKGLEWDRVYMMAVNNYNFPSADPFDSFIGERWFVRDGLNLEAEARAQLDALYESLPYQEGRATQEARIEYAAERLRLLYVGITRARHDLILTWNTGRRGEQVEARPLAALRGRLASEEQE
jgi:DNA helicase-2/ATP-dependent DNA helicase PcrA